MLPVTTEDKERLEGSSALCLTYNGKPIAILREPEFYTHRKDERACRQWGVFTKEHPYIKVRKTISQTWCSSVGSILQ